ncbi:MAG: NAD(P)/FAD-dependent oxidoreductase [Deltaproteobacteria bacterium]|nr:NAD(P)/FAD-dependent oxidoreductase [Deltaproteobacteria bacterium]
MAERYDILVIGGGPGGHAAALEAARLGARTAVIERQGWGGTCTHRGCIPTKALLACSRAYAELGKLKRLGVQIGESAFDYGAMKRHQEQVVKLSALGVRKSLEEAGVALLAGEGRLVGPQEVAWTEQDGTVGELAAAKIVIAWGSEPALPPGIIPSARILTSDGILALPALPESLLIVGGNVIGMEFATFFAELGVPVTLIEWLPQLLPGEEAEASALLTQGLKKLGVAIQTGLRVDRIRDRGVGVELDASAAPPPPTGTLPELLLSEGNRPADASVPGFSAQYALVCTGRRPCLREAELSALGIRYDRRGIAVDREQQTSVKGIYAVGDVTGTPMLAHRAMAQGRRLAGRLCSDEGTKLQSETLPAVVYTHPPLARVGPTEAEARAQGLAIEVHRSDYGANLTARTQLMGPGFVKLLFCGEKLLGATIVGDQAGELIAPLGLAISAGLGRRELREWVIPHPTLSEILAI